MRRVPCAGKGKPDESSFGSAARPGEEDDDRSACGISGKSAEGSAGQPDAQCRLNANEAKAIAVYLLRDQLTNPKIAKDAVAKVHGVKYEYFEEHVANVSQRTLARLTPKATGA